MEQQLQCVDVSQQNFVKVYFKECSTECKAGIILYAINTKNNSFCDPY